MSHQWLIVIFHEFRYMQPLVTIFDTAASSRNLGDQIIMDAVRNQLRIAAPEAFYVTVPTHDFLGREGRKLIEDSAAKIVGGTNLLSSEVNKYNQWKVAAKDLRWLRGVILLGVGWWQYQRSPNIWTRIFLRRVLHPQFEHSLRDAYSVNQLRRAGLPNAKNTSCVTLWEFDETKQASIPRERSGAVVTTLTDYKPDPQRDRAMLSLLASKYDKVYLWLQGSRDYKYFVSLGFEGVEIIDPQLLAYDDLLSSNIGLDFVGTRLHAGIRAMKSGRRSIILGVDNRAQEISKSVGLKVHPRNQGTAALSELISSEFPTVLTLPWVEIAAWRAALRRELRLPINEPPPIS